MKDWCDRSGEDKSPVRASRMTFNTHDVRGMHFGVWGNFAGVSGDVSGLSGDVTDVTGRATGITLCCTDKTGNLSELVATERGV